MKGFLSLNQRNKAEKLLFVLIVLFLPTQLGKHFWPDFASLLGLRIDYLSPTVYLTDILVSALFIFWLFRILENRIRPGSKRIDKKLKINIKNPRRFNYFFGTFALLFFLLNITISGVLLNGMYHLLKLTEMSFLCYYSAKFIHSKEDIKHIIAALGVGAVAESLLAIFQFLHHSSIGGLFYFLGERTFSASTPGIANASLNGDLVMRPYGTFSHPNVLAGYLVVVLILTLFNHFLYHMERNSKALPAGRLESLIWGTPPSLQSLLAIAVLLLGTISLFLTMSRIAILLWVLIVAYYLFRTMILRSYSSNDQSKSRSYGSIQTRTVNMRAIVPVGFVGILLAIFLLSPLGARFTSFNIKDEAFVQREELIGSSLKMISTSPLLGVGMGNFLPRLSQIQKPVSVKPNLQPVHNIFLLIASETGLIGLGFFIWFLFKIYQRIFYCHPELVSGSRKMPKLVRHDRPKGLIIAISSILVLGLFDHYWLTLQQGQLLFAFIIGLCWASLKLSNS